MNPVLLGSNGSPHSRSQNLLRSLVSIFALLLWCQPAAAVDGVIELNASAISVGGVTPGDAPGYPATLSQPGSYVLTSDLSVPSSAATAIEILVDGVSLDLNGFTLSGPSLCAGDPVSCSPAGIGVGVSSIGANTLVFEGSVTGMGDAGLRLGPLARVANVSAWLNAGNGIQTGPGSEIRESHAERNGGIGIDAGAGSLAIDNVVRGNLGLGLQLGSDGGYLHNVFSQNAPPGISGGGQLGANACPAAGASCPLPQIDCGGLCSDVLTDPVNCGACGNPCAGSQVCVSGLCVLSCPTGQENCGDVCVDTGSDEANCGGCGNSCSTGFRCDFGTCQLSCPPGLPQCGGACVDVATDEAHCGGCGNACSVGRYCTAGTCSLP